ncbi:TRAP transporter substrate-binding protein DctP [Desulfuromonas acetoxidans]|uniref:TRAP dicarboxylate transporter- DctP subunit n=1 Tax=Desulfuromonas acetoxidans (strain DSM 684 / 11070) TaxID=281689 RepID=Q1K1C8_DESA6|nr:TRAP transporter substrate-binding protein DctP [Desulfuromonas acetoxidans]EAT16460.1 TRAP dicarboxylate transporter- DctP subunit [Desulfuromonas acetoxidans DSM 684]MBF0644867.1 TRAP transporter substrate-binding protein DctP [Desulfuromonas acetoxidans]NVD23600.1 TRAP transporter substrate-binding protein DctP [Desulfuromonas acetoxidans]NVE16015.1 TRAP transporter substrate-binding protein DctP [Desulfuromonas acetoxidans]
MRSKIRLISLVVGALLMAHSGWAATTLKIATVAPEGSSWMQKMRAGAVEIKQRTEGRVVLKFYGGGVMGNEKSVFRKMRVGQLHGGAFTGGGLSKIVPDMMLYGLPLLTRSTAEMNYIRHQMDAQLIERLDKAGLVCFGFASGGFAKLMTQKPVASVEDLKGKKVWVPEGDTVSYEVMEGLGVAPVTLPLSDVLTGLQTGLVDVVATSPLGALAFQWYTRVGYITDMPLVYISGALVVDKRRFSRLTAGDQKVVHEILEAIYQDIDQQTDVDNQQALQTLLGQGLQLIKPADGEYERWNTVATKVIDAVAARGNFPDDLYQQAQQHLSVFRQQHAVVSE